VAVVGNVVVVFVVGIVALTDSGARTSRQDRPARTGSRGLTLSGR